jgi:predicted nucleic acid-binding OB-fold protein
MIGAFIIEDENEEVIKEQVKLLRKQKPVVPADGGSGLGSIEVRLTNLESRIETLIKEFKDEQSANRHKLEYELKSVSSQIPNKMEPLEVFNTLSLRELTKRLIAAGLAEQTAIKIAESVESERQQKNFESLSDVVARVKINRGKGQIKGISSDKMVAIVNSWSQVLFI